MMQTIIFKNKLGIKVAGNLHLPIDFDEKKKYSAIISSGPAGAIKEQTAGLYAKKLAEDGFISLALDGPFQGESHGEPRFQERPVVRIEDIRSAVDFLVTLSYVDENKIAVLGICAGGGYTTSAAMTERRIKAVGLVVPVNGGREMRAAGSEVTIASLEAIAQQRTAEARGGDPMLIPWMSDDYKDSEDIDSREGYDYYLTPRGQDKNWDNKMRFTSMDSVLGYDAFYLADTLLTQPLQVIVGSEVGSFGSKFDGQELYNKAASMDKNIVVMEGASHFDLYDQPEFVEPAVQLLSDFYRKSLL